MNYFVLKNSSIIQYVWVKSQTKCHVYFSVFVRTQTFSVKPSAEGLDKGKQVNKRK